MIGLGIMGLAMAKNLLRAGFAVQGCDVSAPRRKAALRAGIAVRKPGELDAPFLVSCLPGAAALHAVAAELTGTPVLVETSTLPIEDKLRAKASLQQRGIVMLDCPLSGTGAQARTKDLVVLASGDRKSFARSKAVLAGFSRSQHYLGEFGNGSKMKYVANLLVAIHNVSAAEAFVLGMKAGLDPQTILEVASDGAGSSRMLEVRGPQMVAGRYRDATMRVEVWQKDMRIIAEFAARLGVATPLFNASGAIYTAAIAQGFARQDTASVCAVLERLSGAARAPRRR
jgi:L-threonate 2-dehydrogenase